MVFQNYALYPHMTAFQNIAFSLELRRYPKELTRRRVLAIAEMLNIGHLMQRKPGQMSGGQQQRVALGRALVKEPVMFLLDEPFSNLDAALRARMRTEVKHLHLRLGTTSVFVTHDQEEALVLSDLIAVMRDGKVVQYASQREVYTRPSNLYVATFVGKPRMSLIGGRLQTEAGQLTFVGTGVKVRLGQIGTQLKDATGEEVVMGLRAENVKIRRCATPAADAIRAEVALLEPVGSDTFVELALEDARIIARTSPDEHFAIGESVELDIAPEKVHLFDAVTEIRLNA
jgi:multiple sugar transport system ATP-binding protein